MATLGAIGANSGITGTGPFTKSGSGALTMSSLIATSSSVTVDGGTLTQLNTQNTYPGGTLTLTNAGSNFTGNIVVDGGTLTASAFSAGATGALGVVNSGGHFVTVNTGSTLRFTVNNIFGNGVGNGGLPAIILNASTLTSTRYNVLGSLTLLGATLTQSATDAGNYEGFQFLGDVTVGGGAPSTISTSAGKANHLGANTTFDVADVTGSNATDLTISAPLRNQSGDFGLGAGALTKVGAGTLTITGAQSYATLNQNDGRTNLNTSLPNATINANGGKLVLFADATNSTVNVNAGGSAYFVSSQTLADLTIADGGYAEVTSIPPAGFDDGGPAFAGEVGVAPEVAAVPEPGTLGLLLIGVAGLLGRHRR